MTANTRLHGGTVAAPDGTLDRLDVLIADGKIAGLIPAEVATDGTAEVIDVSGHLVAPGLIDLQINGGWGHDFTGDPRSIGEVAQHLPSTGVTSFLPTIVTSSRARREAATEALAALTPNTGAATVIGLHFEGPMISPERPGAHDTREIGKPSNDELRSWTREGGISMVTIAPEIDGALDVIRQLRAAGVVVSAGHTGCSAAEFAAARSAGASMVTHLFNAMAPFSHRDPGPVGATLADAGVHAGIICDGIHVDPIAVRMACRALGLDRVILVTDAVAALGLEHGTSRVGDATVTVSERGVRMDNDVLAGSNLSLDQAIRNLVSFTGCSPAQAIRAATRNPADLLGIADRGRLQVGRIADLVVFDEGLHPQRTIIGGHSVWKS